MTDDQFAVIVYLLTEIKDAVEALAPAEENVEELAVCAHPEEARISMATLREPTRWVCGVCKHDSGTELVRN